MDHQSKCFSKNGMTMQLYRDNQAVFFMGSHYYSDKPQLSISGPTILFTV